MCIDDIFGNGSLSALLSPLCQYVQLPTFHYGIRIKFDKTFSKSKQFGYCAYQETCRRNFEIKISSFWEGGFRQIIQNS